MAEYGSRDAELMGEARASYAKLHRGVVALCWLRCRFVVCFRDLD